MGPIKATEAGEGVAEGRTVSYDGYGYQKNLRTALPQLIAVSVKNLLLLGYGMTLGFPTILIPAVSNPVDGETLHLQAPEISWISSINLIVVPLGCALSGVVTTPLGRRRSMQLVNIPFFAAWLLLHFATKTSHLYGALLLTGLAGGLLEAPVLTYVAEVTQPHLRGALTATSSMSIIIGVFTQFLFGLFMYWRTVALFNIIFTVMAVVALCFVPESPHWLMSRRRVDDARTSLQWLRGWTSASAVEGELKDIQALFNIKSGKAEEEEEEGWIKTLSRYTQRSFLVPYFLVSYAFFVGHFSGMTTLQTYAVSIFQMLEAPMDKYYATLLLGLVQIGGSGLCVALVHYTGKRPLAFCSTAGVGLCCFAVAAYDAATKASGNSAQWNQAEPNVTSNATDAVNSSSVSHEYQWVPTLFLMLLAALSHIGIRLLPWILIGEVFSARTRSGAAGLSSAVGYIFGFLANKFFITMVKSMSIWGTYGFYGIISLTAPVVFYFILPETEGKRLNDIEDHFAGIKRLSNKVYKSKRNRPGIQITSINGCHGMANPTYQSETSKL